MSMILALDSSTDACSVALYCDGVVHAKFELAAKSHTQRLLPMVDELLVDQGVSLRQLDAIAFGRGPGSFTGLRICMGIVQGLAFGAQLPVIPVSTLEAMALEYYLANPQVQAPVLAALDARMGEVYWGLYERAGKAVRSLAAEAVMAPTALLQEAFWNDLPSGVVALGPGWHYPELADVTVEGRQLDSYPRAEAMVLIAAEVWAKGEAMDVLDAQPVYLRDSVSWQKRQRIRQI